MLRRHVRCPSAGLLNAIRMLTVTPVAMPSLSPTMEHGKISEWVAKVGDKVAGGETWCKVETDKAVVSFDNVAEEGYVARILANASADSVKVGTPIALLVDEKEGIDAPEVKNWSAAAPAAAAAAAPTVAPEAPSASAVTSASTASSPVSTGRVFASPIAKKTAAELGVDINTIRGTGGAIGRVTKQDVVEAAKSSPAVATPSVPVAAAVPIAAPIKPVATVQAAAVPVIGGAYEDIPVTSMRATIAKRLTQSKNVEVPHYYLMNECNAENMLAIIKQLNAKGAGKFKLTVNDYLVKAIARANLLVPACNSSWMGDTIRQYKGVDVSVAVATPTGLITPIIKNAHLKGLAEISIETKELAKKAREGTLQPNEFIGGTVSISNLGASGIPNFTAIINPPQSMILAVGTLVPKPEIVKGEDGEFTMTGKVVQTISFTASFDHRVVDGAVGAEWFKHFKDAIENPLSLLL